MKSEISKVIALALLSVSQFSVFAQSEKPPISIGAVLSLTAAKSHPLKGAPKALPTSAYRLIDPSAQLGKEWEQSPLEVTKDSALVIR